MLCDTGPLLALIDADDQAHGACVAALRSLPPHPLVVTWPCLTEAMYLLWREGGPVAQEALWSYLDDGLVVLHTPERDEWVRMRELMQEYRDTPMDLADASVVVAAERLDCRQVFRIRPAKYTPLRRGGPGARWDAMSGESVAGRRLRRGGRDIRRPRCPGRAAGPGEIGSRRSCSPSGPGRAPRFGSPGAWRRAPADRGCTRTCRVRGAWRSGSGCTESPPRGPRVGFRRTASSCVLRRKAEGRARPRCCRCPG
jgi:hypothetical protein